MTSAASDGETVEICSTDGTKLCAQWWLTDSVDAPSVTVLVVHGVHQSGHLYRRGGTSTLVDRLCTNARANVLCLDLRGFGRSEGDANVGSYHETFMEDVRVALRYATATFPGKCIYFGHSLGGLIGASLACDVSPPPEVCAYMLSAPTVNIAINCCARAALRLIVQCKPGHDVVGQMAVRGADGCTNNTAFADEFEQESPDRPFPARYVQASKRIVDVTKRRWQHFHAPCLVLSGPASATDLPEGDTIRPGGANLLDKSPRESFIAHDVHHANCEEMVTAINEAGVVVAELCNISAAPHDLVFEPAAGSNGNAAVHAIVEYVVRISAADCTALEPEPEPVLEPEPEP